MENEVRAIDKLVKYADASVQLADSYRAMLKKIWDRANPSLLDDNSQTRLDPDLMDELDTLLHGETPPK